MKGRTIERNVAQLHVVRSGVAHEYDIRVHIPSALRLREELEQDGIGGLEARSGIRRDVPLICSGGNIAKRIQRWRWSWLETWRGCRVRRNTGSRYHQR